MAQKQGISTTALRALRTLEVVSESTSALSVREIADRIGLDKINAYRMLITLETAGYVVHDMDTNRYSLSHKVVSLSRNLLAENEVTSMIVKAMRELSVVTQETLHYSVLDDTAAVLVNRVKGSQLVSVDFQIGDRSPLHCTSIGKVLLSYQDVRFVERYIAIGMTQKASKTITDATFLRDELARVRAQGYAFDDHEFSDNMRCVAAPIYESGGRVCSGLSISGPDSRFDLSYLHELRDRLVATTRSLSRRLGGIPWNDEGIATTNT